MNNNNNAPPGHHNNNNNPAPAVGEGLHAAHQAILQQGGPVGFQPYHRPLRFPFRVRGPSGCTAARPPTGQLSCPQRVLPVSPQIVLLIAFLCITLLVASLVCLTLPGETWGHSYKPAFNNTSTLQCLLYVFLVFTGRWLMSFWTGSSKIHELYTAACGLYVCWLSIRGVTVLLAWMPQGRTVIVHKVQEWTLMVGFFERAPKKTSFWM